MVAALLAGAAAGALGGAPGLTNTAVTFGVLWALEKYTELHQEQGWNGWLLVLCVSLAVYRASLWLHDRPEFVASLFVCD